MNAEPEFDIKRARRLARQHGIQIAFDHEGVLRAVGFQSNMWARSPHQVPQAYEGSQYTWHWVGNDVGRLTADCKRDVAISDVLSDRVPHEDRVCLNCAKKFGDPPRK